jgi:hypothetical protein
MELRLNIKESSIRKKRGISFFEGKGNQDLDLLNNSEGEQNMLAGIKCQKGNHEIHNINLRSHKDVTQYIEGMGSGMSSMLTRATPHTAVQKGHLGGSKNQGSHADLDSAMPKYTGSK